MATASRTTTLKTAIRTYSYTKGLKDGTVTVPGIQFEHIEINPIIGAFRRMCVSGVRCRRDGHHHLSDGQGLQQALHGPTSLCPAPVPSRPYRV